MHNAYNLLPGTKALQVLWKRGNKVAATKVRARDHREPPRRRANPPNSVPARSIRTRARFPRDGVLTR